MVQVLEICSEECSTAVRLKRVALGVPAFFLLGGIIALTLDLRFGVLAAALILGWTQLVGL